MKCLLSSVEGKLLFRLTQHIKVRVDVKWDMEAAMITPVISQRVKEAISASSYQIVYVSLLFFLQ
jgi:hypothetical protein